LSSIPSGPRICSLHCLQRVAKNWLLGQTPLAIFGSSIEMANSPALHAVIFRIGEVVCAAPAGIVREILPRLPATRIPGVPEEVEGLVNVRGTLLTVLDGHLLLQQERRPSDEGAIVVLEVRGRSYGLGVGQVLDFLEVPAAAVVERRELPGVDPRLVKAVGLEADRHFILLDVEAAFAPIIGG
jgi:purine-binding chemotaxis protein CheW